MNKHQGFAIVATLLVVAIIGVMVAGSLWLSSLNRRINQNDAITTQVVNVAQGGNAYWKAELVSLYKHMAKNFKDYEAAILAYTESGKSISCGNYFAIGLDVDRNGTIEQANPSTLPSLSIPVATSTGTVSTRFEATGSTVRLTSVASLNGARATIVDEFNVSTVDIWNNAVFAQTGASNAVIQGRAEIRGAIHILGTGVANDTVVLGTSGSFGMGNTYKNLNSSLSINTMRLTSPNPTDLCATLRVRNGKVNLEGNAQLGYPQGSNTTFADNLRGIYTNGVIAGGVEGSNIFSMNGMTAKYDAGNSFVFPELNSPIKEGETTTWAQQLRENSLVLSNDANDDRRKRPSLINGVITWPIGITGTLTTGSTYLSAGCQNPLFGVSKDNVQASAPSQSFPSYLKNVVTVGAIFAPPIVRETLPTLMGLGGKKPGQGAGGVATQFQLVHGTTPDFTCIKYKMKGSIPNPASDEVVTEVQWNKTTNELYMGGKSGVVTFLGMDLTLDGGNGSTVDITYKGDGVLFAEASAFTTSTSGVAASGKGGNVYVNVDFTPTDGKRAMMDATTGKRIADSTTIKNTYPGTTIMGIVARNDFYSDEAQKRFTLAIYAQEGVKVEKQTLVAGSIVTKVFDAGSNVPTVLYVPNLSERISRFMPGAGGTGYVISNVAWSRQ